MQNCLDHFRSLARQLEAAAIAHNAQQAALHISIENETTRLRDLERIGTDQAAIEEARATVRKLKADRASARAPSFVNPLPDVERWATNHASAEALPPISVKVPNGQTPLAAYNNASEATNKVLAEIARVEAAPLNDPDAIARQVDALAAPARILNGSVILPRHLVRGPNGTAISVVNTEGLFAWLHRNALIAALQEAAANDGPGMTRAERDAALAVLQGDFANALRFEAAAAMAAEKAGQSVIRRRHVHPAILLGLKAPARAVYDWFAQRKGV